MFQTRHAITDPDIDVDKIVSPALRHIIGFYDTICAAHNDQSEIFFIDPYNKFFFSMLDCSMRFRIEETTSGYDGATAVLVPVIRAIYVTKFHRGKGIQERLIREIMGASHSTGTSLGIIADPFEIVTDGGYSLHNSREALLAFIQCGYRPADNYLYDLAIQRQRFMRLGFRNCRLLDAEVTAPFQHFLYVPDTAPEPVKRLQDALEIKYDVNWDFFIKDGNDLV